MCATVNPRPNDPRLTAFLDAIPDVDAWRALDALLSGDVGAASRDSVAQRLARSSRMAHQIDDVLAEVRLKLTRKLWSLRAGVGEPIEDILAYSVTVSAHCCHALMRQQFPERTRLRNRLRYALTHHPDTRLEEDAHGLWRCRATSATFATAATSSHRTQALLETPQAFASDHLVDPAAALPALAAALLTACGQPVDFDRFVDAMAVLLGVSDAPPVTSATDPGAADRLGQVADPAPSISAVLEQRTALQDVWKELVALPPRQRSALLLNLRDPDGGAILQLLPATGVVSMAEIAAALEIPERDLARLWPDLPLDDLSIAARMGITRQQVINLRKSGRARLARRLTGDRS